MNPYLTPVNEVPRWHQRAGCVHDPDLFFDPQRVSEAVAVCEACPVRAQCSEMAQRHRERNGVWGGTYLGRQQPGERMVS